MLSNLCLQMARVMTSWHVKQDRHAAWWEGLLWKKRTWWKTIQNEKWKHFFLLLWSGCTVIDYQKMEIKYHSVFDSYKLFRCIKLCHGVAWRYIWNNELIASRRRTTCYHWCPSVEKTMYNACPSIKYLTVVQSLRHTTLTSFAVQTSSQ